MNRFIIEKLVYGGSGVGFEGGVPVFVPMTAPGDEIEYAIVKKHAGYIEGRLAKVLRPSPNRVTPKCEYYGRCGGCQWQHIDYAAQILWKQLILEEQLKRIAKIRSPLVMPTVPSPRVWNYRSRIKLHRGKDGKIGFFAPGTHELVEIKLCLISDISIGAANISIDECGFTQVNPLQNENLKKVVVSLVKEAGAKTVLELYCGSGNLTEPIAEFASEVIAVDSDKNAVASAKKLNNVSLRLSATGCPRRPTFGGCPGSVSFIHQSARVAVNSVLKKSAQFDCIVLDPPRDGCKEVIDGIIKLAPRHIIYVSCNPSTLARDVRGFIDGGYKLIHSQPIDMFPQTYHIESVSYLEAVTLSPRILMSRATGPKIGIICLKNRQK